MHLSSPSQPRPKFWIAAVAMLVIGATVVAQQPTFSVNVKVVNVLATVRDKQGSIINAL